mgnify:CR=1 FL=1
MLHNILLKAGEWNPIAKQGKFINVVLAAGDISARITKLNNQTFETKLVSGMAFPIPDGFQSVAFLSEVSQQTKVWLGDLPLTYSPQESRIVGSSAIESKTVKLYSDKVTEILPAANGRSKSFISGLGDIKVGGVDVDSRKGIPVASGERFEIETQGAIYGFADSDNYPYIFYADLSNDAVVTPAPAYLSGEYSVRHKENVFHNLLGGFGYTNSNTGVTVAIPQLAGYASKNGFILKGGFILGGATKAGNIYTFKINVETLAVELVLYAVTIGNPVFIAFDDVNFAWSCTDGRVFINGTLAHTLNSYDTSCFFDGKGGFFACSNEFVVYSGNFIDFSVIYTIPFGLNPVISSYIDSLTKELILNRGSWEKEVLRIDSTGGVLVLSNVDSTFSSYRALGDFSYVASTSELRVYNKNSLVTKVIFDSSFSLYPKNITVTEDGFVWVSAVTAAKLVSGKPVPAGGLDIAVLSEVN